MNIAWTYEIGLPKTRSINPNLLGNTGPIKKNISLIFEKSSNLEI